MVVAEPSVDPTALMPVDPYDPAWIEFNRLFPNLPKSLGAAAADGDGGDGGAGDSDDGADDGAKGKAGDDGSAGDDGGKANAGGKAGDDGGTSGDRGAGDDGKAGDQGGDKSDTDNSFQARVKGFKDKDAKKFAERFTGDEDVVKAALDFRKKLSNAVVVPGKDATDEEKAAFAKAMDVPAEADGYELAVSDDVPEIVADVYNDDMLKFAAGAFHEFNVPKAAAQGLLEKMIERDKANLEQLAEDQKAAVDKATDALKKEWGDDAPANEQFAQRAAKEFGDEAFADLLENNTADGVPIGDHPAFSKVFAKIGRMLAEDRPMLGLSGDEQKSLDEQIDELTTKIADAHQQGDDKAVNRLSDQRAKLSDQLYGTQPADGRAA